MMRGNVGTIVEPPVEASAKQLPLLAAHNHLQ